MNYRHAYHAGNAADCAKHALLVWLLRALRRKPAGFTVLDTHAGIGVYHLSSPEAAATGEWRQGIGRLRSDPALADYLAIARASAFAHEPETEPLTYPGSPTIARRLLRPQDRLICCELHQPDAASLRRLFRNDAQVSVHHRDGYEALGALLPPATRRGLVLIDPPYEQPGEYDRLIEGLHTASRRFRAGVLAAWYPIKHLAPVRTLHRRAAELRDVVAASLTLRPPLDPQRLNGSGLLVVNAPFGFEAAAAAILQAMRDQLGEDGAGYSVERIADE